ncbi:DsbA family protein [Vibrio hannami]|uniref:DsbA family protein n=1 Tax=Vibrio hannami TaxID=2717094 RepID=UPI00240E9D9D|nr:DsbA family protein [Vibrio hannami]MDG3085069.1 DsbA family protein [Vibrio hannami]
MADSKFIIIYDTYCGWCYGAAPVFDALIRYGAEVELLHRHLFEGENAPRMTEGKGEYVLKADAKIKELTGQTFSKAYNENIVRSDSEILDSTYSAQAAALVRELGPEKELSICKRLEEKGFVEGISAQNRQHVVDTLIAEGVPKEKAELVGSEVMADKVKAASSKAIELMQRVGSIGVPTILKVIGDSIEQVDHTEFYNNPEAARLLI